MKLKLLILALILGMIGMVSAASSSDLQLHYTFNGSCDPQDVSGNGNDGVCQQSPSTGLNGQFDDAYGFVNGPWIDVPKNFFSFDLSTSFSVAGWCKVDKNTDVKEGYLLYAGNHDIDFRCKDNNNHANFRIYDGSVTSVSSSEDLLGDLFYYSAVYNNSNGEMVLYVNGSQVDSIVYSGSGPNSVSRERAIGSRQDTNEEDKYDVELVDEFRIYSEALSNNEINNLYNCNQLTSCNNRPQFDSVSFIPSTWTLNNDVDVDANVSDSDGTVQSVEADVYEDGTQIVSGQSLTKNSGTWEADNLFTPDETNVYYNVTLTATDDNGATTTYKENQFIEDSKPTFNIKKPENKTIGTQNLNWTLNETSDGDDVLNEDLDVTIYEDGNQVGTDNITEGQESTGSWTSTDGKHKLKAEISEKDGDSKTKTVKYEVDTGFGNINITKPQNNSNTKDLDKIRLNYTIKNEPNLDTSSCEYSKDGGTNISINNCGNTTIQFGEVGNHTVKIYAKDTLGNYGSDKVEFFADQENQINISDKKTGNTISDFQVTLENGSKTIGGTSKNSKFTFLTSKAPKGPKVDLSIKADNYVAFKKELNITDSFSKDLSYKLKRAGLELSAYDEQSNNKLDEPVLVTLRNESSSKQIAWGNSFQSSSGGSSDPQKVFDGDLNSKTSRQGGTAGSSTVVTTSFTGFIGLEEKENQKIKVKFNAGNDASLTKIQAEKNGVWETLFNNNDGSGSRTETINNNESDYSGRIKVVMRGVRDANDGYSWDLYEVYPDNLTSPSFDSKNIPVGNMRVKFEEVGPREYKARTYRLNTDKFSRISLRGYLLQKGEGIYMAIETLNSQGEKIQDSLINVQRNFGGTYRTISQKITGTDGSTSVYVDPDIPYKVTASNPKYSTFEGTFNPANYQYDPLQIQLGNKNRFNFSTRWDTIDYKLTPEERFLNKSKIENIEWTVTDGKSDLTEFGIRLKYKNGTKIKTKNILSSPSGGTVNLSINGSKYKQDTEFQVEAYLITGGDEYRIEKVYEFARSWTAGLFSLSNILDTDGDGIGDTGKGMLSLLVTLMVGGSLGKRFDKEGAGFIVITVLGIFTIAQWFPLEIWTITFLGLLGTYLFR